MTTSSGIRDARRVLDLCDAALQLERPQRERFLARECADRPDILLWVSEVMSAIDQSGSFLIPEDPPN